VRFLLQSMFWMAVVGAFLPRDVAAEQDAATDFQASAARLCIDRPEVCTVGVEAAKLAVDLGEVAVSAARDALDEEASSS
jgi:hypothetical protein